MKLAYFLSAMVVGLVGAQSTGGYVPCVTNTLGGMAACLNTPYDCVGGFCQPPRPGHECVAKGEVPNPNSGPKKCCYGFPTIAGKPCEPPVFELPEPDPDYGKTGSKCGSILDCFAIE
ncbi:hypothetical protein DM01DRAFT_1343494 [Hesseltinella vesiculosa]|uniref:Uncharacterized protein n=1 Tax=Hesseltinella vesiculosa TaxID=101127 RepID=A0A1X2GRN4_9FUNG|nr:hypothetical protein DM01DRAFT_1343494 [Hesseltinella vesiculosa]